MKILAVYGSNYGQTEAVIRRIAQALEALGHEVNVFKGDSVPASVVVEDYGAVVVGASILVGKYQDYIRDFVTRNLPALQARPTAFVSVNGGNPESSPEWQVQAAQYVATFLQATGWAPRWTAKFGGALRFRHYGIVTRWIMKMISRRSGGPTDTSREYEFTDWEAVDRFGREVAEGLAGRSP